MTESNVAGEIRWILASLGDTLPAVDQGIIGGFVDYGEYALALETLCDQMCEREVVPARPVHERIMALASALRIAPSRARAVPTPKGPGSVG